MRPHSRLALWILTLFACVALFACGDHRGDGATLPASPSARPADRVIATILMTNDQLTLIGLRPATGNELPEPQAVAPVLGWQYEDSSGKIVESGTVTVPVVTLAEFDENGKPAPVTTVAGAATLEVQIPNVDGTFVLFDPAATGGTTQKSWGGLLKKLKLYIKKLIGKFKLDNGSGNGGSGGSVASGGTSAGGASAGGASTGGASAGGASVGGASAGGASTGGASTGGAGPGGPGQGPAAESGPTVQMAKPKTECVGMTILVVAEGYTKAEETKFQADAEQIIGAISTHSGYQEHWSDVAVYRKFFVSNDSGISDPAASITRDTAFRFQHDAVVHRSIGPAEDVPAANVAAVAAAKGEVNADAVLYIANISEWAGAARPWSREGYVAAHPQAGLIMSHELAHALFDLADEYSDGTCNPANSFQGPNVALSLEALPWTSLLTPGVALPTTGGGADTVGAYEGALYCTTGAYRPQDTCKMRDASVGFCKVCLAQIESRFQLRTAACHQGTCEHSACTTGSALTKGCDSCTASVCDAMPECCSTEKGKGWTEACVQLAKDTAGPCRGVCYDGKSSCSHTECTDGASLTSSCSTCADAVCKKDAFCCSNKWDAICANEAERDPYCSCKTSQ